MRKGTERLLEVSPGLAVRPPRIGLLPTLPAIQQGLGPPLAPQGMVGQALDLRGHPVTRGRLQGLDDARMQRPPPFLEETAIGHLVGEDMLEGVDEVGKELRFVQELSRLKLPEAAV